MHPFFAKSQCFFLSALLAAAALIAPTSRADVLISGDTITISSRSLPPSKNVYLASDLQRWDATRTKMKEASPGYYTLTLPKPWTQMFVYKFVVDGSWTFDSENPDRIADGFGSWNSVLRLPGFPDEPLLQRDSTVPAWEESWYVVNRGSSSYEITVLSPPESAGTDRPLRTVYVNDGSDYRTRTGLKFLAENLSREKDWLLRVVLIKANDRMRDYFMSRDYAEWVSNTLIPVIEQRTGITDDRDSRWYLGASLGGLAVIHHAAAFPEDFSLIMAQSPSLQLADAGTRIQLAQAVSVNTILILSAGQYETLELAEATTSFHALIHARGAASTYQEYPCTHDWPCWNAQLPALRDAF